MRCNWGKRIPSPSVSVGLGEIEENRALLELARQLQAQVWGCNHAGFGKRLVQSFPSSAVEQREVATPFHTAMSAILLEGQHDIKDVSFQRRGNSVVRRLARSGIGRIWTPVSGQQLLQNQCHINSHRYVVKPANALAQQPAYAGRVVELGEPLLAWPVCCSKWFGS